MEHLQTEWVRQPQEQGGDYWFSGHFYITQGVKALLTEEEIFWIYMEIQMLTKEQEGLDYLQVYKRKTDGQKLFFIDQLTRDQVKSGDYLPEYDYCTLMLASEY